MKQPMREKVTYSKSRLEHIRTRTEMSALTDQVRPEKVGEVWQFLAYRDLPQGSATRCGTKGS